MVSRGYEYLLHQFVLLDKSTLWNNVWHQDRLPKVNIFCWALAHEKILTNENIRKGGIFGPSRCALCKENSESIQHMFLECMFVKEVWQTMLQELFHRVLWSDSAKSLLENWHRHYEGSFRNKSIFRPLWVALPKYICRRVWLVRNKNAFKDEHVRERRVITQTKSQVTEYFNSHRLTIDFPQSLDQQEHEWLDKFNLQIKV